MLQGLQSVTAESDSKSAVLKLKSSALDYSEIGPIFSGHFASGEFSFKSRTCNNAAHALTAEGLTKLHDRFWVEDAPEMILQIATMKGPIFLLYSLGVFLLYRCLGISPIFSSILF
ncbi:hypothetical protein V6N13_033876 [Hibiscus sabdariffa]